MSRLSFSTLLLATIFAPAAFAESPQEYFADRALQEEEGIARFLQLRDDEGVADIQKGDLRTADINRDGATDYLWIAFANRAATVTLYMGTRYEGEAENFEDAFFAGFIAVDCDTAPSLNIADVTGDGVDEIQIEARVADGRGGARKTIKFAGYDAATGSMQTIFFATLDSAERYSIYRKRSTHLVNVVDLDDDGTNEVQVTSRWVELIGEGVQETEIPESMSLCTSTYKLSGGVYEITNTVASEPSDDKRLMVAGKLAAAGEQDRATAMLSQLIESPTSSLVVVERARTLLHDTAAACSGATDVVDAGAPDVPSVEVAVADEPRA